jgi:hypothetical protein
MTNKMKDLQGVSPLSKAAQKEIRGGSTAGGSCGSVLTTSSGKRCVVGGMPRAQAISNSAEFNSGTGQFNDGGYGGQVTDVNWCCASCGNFESCDKVLLDA